jgi:tRNA A-37 threonylcarbamoyl transferase component Bud32
MADNLEITTGLGPLLASAGIRDVADALDPDLGEPVIASRSSWVRRVPAGGTALYVKCFVYPTLKDVVLRIVSRRFLWHRARREWRCLELQEKLGLPVPVRVALGERRRSGILRAAVLVTQEVAGARRLDHRLLADGGGGLPERVGRYVARLHLAGFTHGDLNARNVLVSGEGSELLNVDSGRGRRRPWRGRFAHDHVRDLAPLVLAFRAIQGEGPANAVVTEYLEEMNLGRPSDLDRRVEAEIGRIERKERARLERG